MILKTKLIASGVVALATTIGVLTTSFNSDKLSSAIQKNKEATKTAIETMQQANNVIIQLDDKVKQDNATIKGLNEQLIGSKNLSKNQKIDIMRELLKSWNYSNTTIKDIIDILEGISWLGNLNTTNHK